MVKITNGSSVLKVTGGAYNSMYKPQGWYLVNEVTVPTDYAPAKAVKPNKVKPSKVESEPTSEPVLNTEEQYEEEEEPEDLSEKPLSEMSFEELVQYAKQLKVYKDSLDTKKKLRSAIREVI